MKQTRTRGNIPHERFVADTLHDLLQEQKKTNLLLERIVTEIEVEGPAERLGKMIDGQKRK